MSIENIEKIVQEEDFYLHIDPGFINRRLCISALPQEVRKYFLEYSKPGEDHFTTLQNDHLLVMLLIDVCESTRTPTLLEALQKDQPKHVFCSTEMLMPCPNIYNASRVSHPVKINVDGVPEVSISYHTEHIFSSTQKMTLSEGWEGGYLQSIIGLLHKRQGRFDIEPLVIGAPWLEHSRNGDYQDMLAWYSQDYGEISPENIDQFSNMSDVQIDSTEEWISAMKEIPEKDVKSAFASLLKEPHKKDWGGETSDHFSGNVMISGRKKTAAFLLKGPAEFREMTLDLCGSRADQIFRLSNTGADVLIIQHCHLIGEAVRATLKNFAVRPGYSKKYCLIDGQATYRILKAYNFI